MNEVEGCWSGVRVVCSLLLEYQPKADSERTGRAEEGKEEEDEAIVGAEAEEQAEESKEESSFSNSSNSSRTPVSRPAPPLKS